MAKEKQTRRMIAMALAAAVVMSSMPVVAFAEGEGAPEIPQVESPAEPASEPTPEPDAENTGLTIEISTVPGEKTNETVVEESEPVIEGDADKSDGNWNYTETTEKTTVSVEAEAGEIIETPGTADMDYVNSDANPDGTNDLIDLLRDPLTEADKIEASDDTGFTLIGAENSSKVIPAVHFGTTALTDKEKLEKWGSDAYLKGGHYYYFNLDGLVDNDKVLFVDDDTPTDKYHHYVVSNGKKIAVDADGHVLDKDGNKLFRQEHSVVGPDGKTYWLRRLDR
ncbi:MAG: hypothetical protein IIV62_05065, partial [Anaerotignum sp.]|nr:hypothetical protein [Anaerotignum sp.]